MGSVSLGVQICTPGPTGTKLETQLEAVLGVLDPLP